MVVITVEVLIIVIAWFAFSGSSNGGRNWLWAILGGIGFIIVLQLSRLLLDPIIEYSLAGSVADYGIYIITTLVAILIGVGVCFLLNKLLASQHGRI